VKPRSLITPLRLPDVVQMEVGDLIEITGVIYTGRDAILPQLVRELDEGRWGGPDLNGGVIFHTGVSVAGVGPTTSNKKEIESSIGPLSRLGIRLHIGKGKLSSSTVQELAHFGSVFAITPPTTALFRDRVTAQRVVAFPNEGMEAMYELTVVRFPAVVAVARNGTIWDNSGGWIGRAIPAGSAPGA